MSKSEREDLRCNDNENVLGKFKDELHGLVMTEFPGLNPKNLRLRVAEKSFGNRRKSKGKGGAKRNGR